MPPARWRRLARSHSCVSCHSESAWCLSSRFRTSREYRRIPPPGVNTEGLVEVITTPVARDRRPTRGPIRTSWTCATRIPELRSVGWTTAPSEITLPRGLEDGVVPMFVSANYFKTLGVTLVRGPGFEAA